MVILPVSEYNINMPSLIILYYIFIITHIPSEFKRRIGSVMFFFLALTTQNCLSLDPRIPCYDSGWFSALQIVPSRTSSRTRLFNCPVKLDTVAKSPGTACSVTFYLLEGAYLGGHWAIAPPFGSPG